MKHRRCLVPATGFYEWQKTGTARIPYYIHRKDGEYLAFAGIYDIWDAPGSRRHLSFAIITSRPNDTVAHYHDRMPAILRESDEETWISPGGLADSELEEILSPYPPGLLEAWQVSQLVNNPENEGENLIARQEGITSFF